MPKATQYFVTWHFWRERIYNFFITCEYVNSYWGEVEANVVFRNVKTLMRWNFILNVTIFSIFANIPCHGLIVTQLTLIISWIFEFSRSHSPNINRLIPIYQLHQNKYIMQMIWCSTWIYCGKSCFWKLNGRQSNW